MGASGKERREGRVRREEGERGEEREREDLLWIHKKAFFTKTEKNFDRTRIK